MLLTLLILAVEKEGKGFFLWAQDDKTPRIYVTRLSDMFNAVTRIMLSTMTGNLSHISLRVAVSSLPRVWCLTLRGRRRFQVFVRHSRQN